MLKTVEGVFRQGRIELYETPGDVHDQTPVVVTFLAPRPVDLRAEGIDETLSRVGEGPQHFAHRRSQPQPLVLLDLGGR